MTRDDLTTPVLIVDLDVMERNLDRMAKFFAGVQLGCGHTSKTTSARTSLGGN